MKRETFQPGQQWVVTGHHASLKGRADGPGGPETTWTQHVPIGTVLTCTNIVTPVETRLPWVRWSHAQGFDLPSSGVFFPATKQGTPPPGYVAPWNEDARLWSMHGGAVSHRSEFPSDVYDAWVKPVQDEKARADLRRDYIRLMDRAAPFEGDWVVWDPEADHEGFLLVGDDPFALLREAVEHFEAIKEMDTRDML